MLEQLRRAVALVDVQVDDRRPRQSMIAAQGVDRDCDVVQHAEPGSFGVERVVRPAGEVSAPAFLERHLSRRQGASHRGERPFDQAFGPGESDPPHNGGVDRAGDEPGNVIGIVGEGDGFRIGQRRALEFKAAVFGQKIAGEAILPHGKLMAIGQRDGVVVAVIERVHLRVR